MRAHDACARTHARPAFPKGPKHEAPRSKKYGDGMSGRSRDGKNKRNIRILNKNTHEMLTEITKIRGSAGCHDIRCKTYTNATRRGLENFFRVIPSNVLQ